jgi:hypothetical protein
MNLVKVTCVNHGFNHYDYYVETLENVVDILRNKDNIVKSFRKEVEDGFIFADFYPGGFCIKGYTIYEDPLHSNKQYTWSSRASVINGVFNLKGTPYELCSSGIGIKQYNPNRYSCFSAVEITVSALRDILKYAIDNQLIKIADSDCTPLDWECKIDCLNDLMKYEENNNVELC